MAHSRKVPSVLLSGPFRGSEVCRAGLLTRDQLRNRRWRRLLTDVYVSADLPDTPELRLRAVRLAAPPGAVASGATAAWLYGADVRWPDEPLEITLPRGTAFRPRPGLSVRRAELLPEDVTEHRGLLVTTPIRTGLDLARLRGPVRDVTEAVVAVDALTRLDLFTPDDLAEYAGRKGFFRWRGIQRALTVAEHADPRSESPGESRLRMRIVRGGLPRPEAQYRLFDPHGRHVARLDLAYPDRRVGVEYDGEVHRDRWRADAARRNAVQSLGWDLYTYTALDLRPGGTTVLTQLRRRLLPP